MPNPIVKSFVPTSLLFQSMTQSSSRVWEPTARLAPRRCFANPQESGSGDRTAHRHSRKVLGSGGPLLWTKIVCLVRAGREQQRPFTPAGFDPVECRADAGTIGREGDGRVLQRWLVDPQLRS
jgi:hypothetical protein